MEQIDTVASWLKSEHPVNLVLFYLDQPANQIRAFGPDSSQADLAVYKVNINKAVNFKRKFIFKNMKLI